jgi:hypothetical protein
MLVPFVNKFYSPFTSRVNIDNIGYCCFVDVSDKINVVDLNYDYYVISKEYDKTFEYLETLGVSKDSIIKGINKYVEKLISKDIQDLKNNYGFPYNISDMGDVYKKLYSSSSKTIPNSEHEKIASYLNYSFGVEIETQSGIVPLNTLLRNDFVILKDGSIKGYEFTSLPLKGADGLAKLQTFCTALNPVAKIDEFCSLHIHLGGFKATPESIVALYKTVYQVQQELFDFVPNYKRSAQYFAKKQDYKDHCKPLKSLGIYGMKDVGEMYDAIFDFVTHKDNGQMLEAQKWNQFPRYHHLNLLNLFSKKNGTIEFRLHEPTTNYQKILSWLLIVNAITSYSSKYQDDIIADKIKIGLKDVITDIYPNRIGSYINSYIKSRTLKFADNYVDNLVEDYHNLSYDNLIYEEALFKTIFISAEVEEEEMV